MRSYRILREKAVGERTGLSRTTRWRLVRKNKFPAPIKISDHAIGWIEYQIDEWVEERSRTAAARIR